MAKGELVDEILRAGKPEPRKPINVSQLVQRHVPLETSRAEAIAELRAQGFNVREERRTIADCNGCDPFVAFAGYVVKSTIFFLPYKSFISIAVGFSDGKVARVIAWHELNVY